MPRKWLFVLPNLFTVSSIFCGIYAITQASAGAAETGEQANLFFFRAAVAILFGSFFDGCDGRVARLTKTESEFGVQLDSLADVITFGVAPAMLLYHWALAPWGVLGVLIAGAFAVCGALRLARFNVMSANEDGPSRYFTGLPIPLAAGMVVGLVVAVTRSPVPVPVEPLPIAVLTLLLSWLMVSTVKYRSGKKMKLRSGEFLLFSSVIVSGAAASSRMGLHLLLAYYFGAYVLIGLIEVWFHIRREHAELRLAATHSAAAILHDDEDPEGELED